MLVLLRYVLPAAVCGAGIVIVLLVGGGGYGPDALSALFGAGGAIYLMNTFMRMGIDGDKERDTEEAARRFYDRYRMWPDEVPAGWRPDDAPDAATAWRRILEESRAA